MAEITFTDALVTSSVPKIIFVVTEISHSEHLFSAKITFVVAELAFKVDVITSLVVKITIDKWF